MDTNLANHATPLALYGFDNGSNLALFNPRLDQATVEELMRRLDLVDHLKGHILVLSSGTTSDQTAPKWIALSKGAILSAAMASNQVLKESSDDVWLHLLPTFHVGGMGIWARSYLSGSQVIDPKIGKWEAQTAVDLFQNSKATLASLVPAQVHDLVMIQALSPKSLRAVLVGGGALSFDVYRKARELGWPLLRTYGMTETASQAATESLETLQGDGPVEASLHVLPHLQARSTAEGRIELKGDSLLTGWIVETENSTPAFCDPKDSEGWLTTQDLGVVKGNALQFQGRVSHIVKILGETVSLAKLESVLAEVSGGFYSYLALVPVPDPRRETNLVLFYENQVGQQPPVDAIISGFNKKVLPYERIQEAIAVSQIPRTDLGKVKLKELITLYESHCAGAKT